MKKFFTMLLLSITMLSFTSCISMTPTPKVDRQYSQIIQVPNTTKEEIYQESLLWLAENFSSNKRIIQYKNASKGKIICEIETYKYYHLCDSYFRSTLTIDIKDNLAKLSFVANSRKALGTSWRPFYVSGSSSIIFLAIKSFNSVQDSYKTYMTKTKNTNW